MGRRVKGVKRGFAVLTRAERRKVSSLGGKAVHQPGNHGHEWTREEATIAGRKGSSVRYALQRAARGESDEVTWPALAGGPARKTG
jgi:hypothetical protein